MCHYNDGENSGVKNIVKQKMLKQQTKRKKGY